MAKRGDFDMGRRQVILIVEDEPLVRMDAAASLRDAGYGVREAANSKQAIDVLQSAPEVDLVFTDINLGKGMNGVELGQWARANLPRLKVLLTSGERANPIVPPALGTILAKPYAIDELLRRVEEKLGDAARLGPTSTSEPYRKRFY